VCAAVVTTVSATATATATATAGDDAVRAALADHAAVHLAGYKRPKEYMVVPRLPRTATGKVRRSALPDLLGPGGGGPGPKGDAPAPG